MPALSHPSADSSNPNSGDKKPGIGNPSQTLQGRPLPNSLDAEQGLLAACIVDTSGEVIGRCMEQSISSDHFYEQSLPKSVDLAGRSFAPRRTVWPSSASRGLPACGGPSRAHHLGK
jgi:hypothetical protein